MGQKIIPISLRLNKKENWSSQWIVEKNNYSLFLHFDLEIRKYFENLFNYKKFKLIQFNLTKTSKNIHIYVYVCSSSSKFYQISYHRFLHQLNLSFPNHHIKIFIKKVSLKYLKPLKKDIKKIYYLIQKSNKINSLIKQMIYYFTYAFYTKNLSMIVSFIQQNLKNKKSHKRKIRIINNILEEYFKIFSNVLGYRLQLKGRLNGSKRKKKILYQKGQLPLNSFQQNIQYHWDLFKTPSGICSIKFWVFFKNN